MKRVVWTPVLGSLLLACAGWPGAQEPRCGPAAAVITTTDQQQAVVTSVQNAPRPLRFRTEFDGQGTPYVVYENGDRFALIPFDEYVAEHQKQGGTDRAGRPKPQLLPPDLAPEELPMSMFVHCQEYLTPAKSQGGRGLCHDFASASVVESLVKRHLMNLGVPPQLAEIDLSEEWMGYEYFRWCNETYGLEKLSGEGGHPNSDLPLVVDKPWPLETYWPYNPLSWPKSDDYDTYPCAEDFVSNEEVNWEYWAHLQPDQSPPRALNALARRTQPRGPVPAIKVREVTFDGDHEKCLETAKTCIREGRTVALAMAWAGDPMWDGSLIRVPDDYPWDLRQKKLDGVALTEAEKATWVEYHPGGHAVQLFGFGKPRTQAEGIWLLKNSHGLGSGHNGIVYITEEALLVSWIDITHCRLATDTINQVAQWADTLLRWTPKHKAPESQDEASQEQGHDKRPER